MFFGSVFIVMVPKSVEGNINKIDDQNEDKNELSSIDPDVINLIKE